MVSKFIEMIKSGDFQPAVNAFTNGMQDLFDFIIAKLEDLFA